MGNRKPRRLDAGSKKSRRQEQAIFGPDPAVGFMSAQNTLYGIPIELGLKDKVIELNSKINAKSGTNNTSVIKIKSNSD